jgi:hypothetical protein
MLCRAYQVWRRFLRCLVSTKGFSDAAVPGSCSPYQSPGNLLFLLTSTRGGVEIHGVGPRRWDAGLLVKPATRETRSLEGILPKPRRPVVRLIDPFQTSGTSVVRLRARPASRPDNLDCANLSRTRLVTVLMPPCRGRAQALQSQCQRKLSPVPFLSAHTPQH